jgi:serine/threonine protein kinase
MNRLLEEFNKKYDDYEIISSIGKDTWQIHLTSYDRLAVLKRVDNPDIYKKLCTLKIRGIPIIYSVFERDGKSYVIEEFVNGTTLDSILASKGKLSAREVRDIVIKLCKILAPLHNAYIVHRDIKPSNVILTSDNSVYLIDFGIARAKTDTATEDTKHLGTEFYASPEQYGFAQSDNRSDIYSIGRLMLVLLTGKENTDSIRRLPYRNIIFKCTQIDSKKRYPNVKSLQHAFGAKIIASAAVIIILISVVSILILTVQSTSTNTPRTSATAPTVDTADDIALTTTASVAEITTDTSAIEYTTEVTSIETTSVVEISTELTTTASVPVPHTATSKTVDKSTEITTKADTVNYPTDNNGFLLNALFYDSNTVFNYVYYDEVSPQDNPYMIVDVTYPKQTGRVEFAQGKSADVYAEQTADGLNITINGSTQFLPHNNSIEHSPNSDLQPTGYIDTIVFNDIDLDGIKEIMLAEMAYWSPDNEITPLYSTASFIRVNTDMSMTLCGGEPIIVHSGEGYLNIEYNSLLTIGDTKNMFTTYELRGNDVIKYIGLYEQGH